MMLRHSLIAAFLLLACAAGDALAYRWERCGWDHERLNWDHSPVRFRVDGTTFPSTSLWRFALAQAVDRFNRSPADFRYELTWGEPGVSRRNHENEIWWSSSINPPAVTRTWYPRHARCVIKEADVIFNTMGGFNIVLGLGDKANFWPYGGSFRPFQNAVLHEIGHAQGLNHTPDTYSIMGQEWDHITANGADATLYPGEDAIAGSVDTYGLHPTEVVEDLGTTHWQWNGRASGAYGQHDRTRIFVSDREALNVGGAEPVYVVAPGDRVVVELGFENMGATPWPVTVGYYLSTDVLIDRSDLLLDSFDTVLERDRMNVQARVLTIPSSTPTGRR
ncbi:MAG: hypothetical protein ACREQ9_17025, partial [Candidatus Binatia bacterium]